MDNEYYFIRKPDDDRLPFLVPDENTEDRCFRFEPQPQGSPPLVFHNGWRDLQRKNKIVGVTPDILFAGADLVVRDAIRERLLEHRIPSMHMHPVVYIDNAGQWHEDFWYLTFADRFDCWDRTTSEFDEESPPIRLGGFQLQEVYTYCLDEELMRQTPLDNRRLFKMGGDLNAFVVCHSSLSHIFRGNGTSGASLMAIADY
ncbi:hypothetical protein FHW83_005787 [Duganella sp. SG902]|uniref:hypothetical protein n=1 Tax=Duganella sp. SG902 TaxID=2587016 RepID=UPI00159E0CE5|nr:hypothetical protein [Duganella sp. SG902]NVM79945.1 hypothetical protein [Duganella sp. SG902]